MCPNRPSSFKRQSTEDVHRLNGRPGGARTKQEKAVYNKLEPGSRLIERQVRDRLREQADL